MNKKLLFLSAFTLLFNFVQAQSVSLSPIQDNTIYSESLNSNGLGKLYAGRTNGGNLRRALIQYDFTVIPPGSIITSVTLTLNVDNVSGSGSAPANSDFTLHKTNTTWGEGSSNGGGAGATAVAPDATWDDAMLGTTVWTTQGGDFTALASATTNLPLATGNFTWSSVGMENDVQGWVNAPLTNMGWILIGDESVNATARRFGSSGAGTAPNMVVEYTCPFAPTATCQNTNVYLEQNGTYVIQDTDIDNGSVSSCGVSLMYNVINPTVNCTQVSNISNLNSLIISAIYDGPLTGGTPKGVELYVINDISDLSVYGLGSANNGGGTDGQEFTFPAVSATAGDYLYISSEAPQFLSWFGFATDYTAGSMGINGDDAVELFKNGSVIDVYGDINTLGDGETWDYTDGWAARNTGSTPNLGIQDDSEWNFSGIDVLDGETDNATALTPIQVGGFTTPGTAGGVSITLEVTDPSNSMTSTCVSTVTVLDTLAPTVSCIASSTHSLDATGTLLLFAADINDGSTDNCGITSMGTNIQTFTCANLGPNNVTLYVYDGSGNIDSCTTVITVVPMNDPSITSITSTMTTCFANCDGGLEIIGSDIDMYSIDNGATYQASNTFTGLCANSYDVMVMSNTANCNQTATMTGVVDEPTEVNATFNVADVDCIGASTGAIDMTVSGGSGIYTFDWDNDGTGDTDDTEDLTLLEDGIYIVMITDDNGCGGSFTANVADGVTLDLTITATGANLMSNQTGASYQWLNCDNSVISGATTQNYLATANGDYKVEVTVGSCVDTSACVTVSGVSINEHTSTTFAVYPNPTTGKIQVKLNNLTEVISLKVLDINGKVMTSQSEVNLTQTIDLSHLANGIYFVQIKTENSMLTKKINIVK